MKARRVKFLQRDGAEQKKRESHGRFCPHPEGALPNQPNRAHSRRVISLEPDPEPESLGPFDSVIIGRAVKGTL